VWPTATALSTILVGPDGDKIIVLVPEANDAYSEQDSAALVTAVHEASERAVLVADLEVPPESIRPALAAVRTSHVAPLRWRSARSRQAW
jgi:sugar/nucleoside kinase (ribokinase family)